MTSAWAVFTSVVVMAAFYAAFVHSYIYASIWFGFAMYTFCAFLRSLVDEAKR